MLIMSIQLKKYNNTKAVSKRKNMKYYNFKYSKGNNSIPFFALLIKLGQDR